MFKTTPFQLIAKTLTQGVENFNPAATEQAIKRLQDNVNAWGELAQTQALSAQANAMKSAEDFKSAKSPRDAFDAMQDYTARAMAFAARHLKEATVLGAAQFNAHVDAIGKAHQIPEAFAGIAKN